MKRSRTLSLILVVLLIIGIISGCNTTQNKVSPSQDPIPSQTPSASPSETEKGPAITFPLAETAEFSMWTPLYSTNLAIYKTLEEHPVVKRLEELTKVHINFVHPTSGSEAENFNLMKASQEYTDVFDTLYSSDSATTLEQNGIIVDLTDLIDQYMPNYAYLGSSAPEIDKEIKDDNSRKLLLYQIYEEVPLAWGGFTVRKDLLDKAELDIPETYDDWEKAGLAFKSMGIEIPFLMPNSGSFTLWNTFESGFGIGSRYYRDNDTVKFGPIEPGYKEYVTKMHSWYEQGIIGKDFAGTTGPLAGLGIDYANVLSGKIGAGNLFSGFLGSQAPESGMTQISDMYLASAYPPVKNKGDKVNFSNVIGSGRIGTGFAISTSAKEDMVPIIMSYFDYLYSDEGYILANYGAEGDGMEFDSNGKPHYTDIINCSAVDGVNTFHIYDKALFQFPFYVIDKERIQGRSDDVIEYQKKWVQTGTELSYLPTLALSADEASQVSSITNDANTYVSEMTVKFITGNESLDNYDTMVNTIKSMGIDNAIAVYQAALDRFNNR